MARLPIKTKTLKHLFAVTGNQCAFPDCQHELFSDDVFVAQVCHIYPAKPNWPRFDSVRTDEDNRAFSNLMVLCYKHHKIVDDLDNPYSIEQMIEIKKMHEQQFMHSPVRLNAKKVENIQRQIDTLWADITDAVDVENAKHGMARAIDPTLDFWKLIEIIETNLNKLANVNSETDEFLALLDETVLPFLQSKGFSPSQSCPIRMFELGYGFSQINWEMRVIGGGNFRGEAMHHLRQLKLRIAEALSLASPDDENLYNLIVKYKKELEDSIEYEVYYD